MSVKTYAVAINEAHKQLLETDESVIVVGQGVDSPWFVGMTTVGLIEKYPDRVLDTPISEAATAGATVGAAMAGMKPIVFFPRMDFMYLTLDQFINHCSSWSYMFDGKVNVPIVIRGLVNRGGEQSSQHSQSPFALYAHIPGFKVVCPATAYDAKGLLIAATKDKNPVVFIEDRWLYSCEQDVPDEMYEVEIGKGNILREGKDITLVCASFMVQEGLKAAQELKNDGIDVEVLDIRSIKPLDEELILKSVAKTKKAVVAVADWEFCGVASYISSVIYDKAFSILEKPIGQVTLPNCHAPASHKLEEVYYPTKDNIVSKIKEILK